LNAKEFLNNVSKEIRYKPANKYISDELESHIEELKNDNLCKGLSEEQAEETAVEQMGDAKKIGKRLNRIHRPKLDWLTLIFVFAFLRFSGFFGVLYYQSDWWNVNDSFYWITHYRLECIGMIFGILISIFLVFFDYRKICKHSKLLYALATILNIVAYFRGFRANGNLLYGLYPFTQTSPAVFSIPLYIIAFAGFLKDINKESKINITISNGKKINSNIVIIVFLSIISVITSLMINFVSGFLVAMVYLIITSRELLNKKQYKNMGILIGISIIIFALLSMMICIIPTREAHSWDPCFSSYWVGIDTTGERKIDFAREKLFENAKMMGKANLEGVYYTEESYKGEYKSSIDGCFIYSDLFQFLGMLSQYGWIASFAFATILLLFCIKLIISTKKVKDPYGKLIAIGITSLYIVQIVCNLAMNLGIIGVAEFDLPLISGSKATIIMDMILMSLFLSVYRRKDINFEEPKKSKLVTKIEDFFFEEVEDYKEKEIY